MSLEYEYEVWASGNSLPDTWWTCTAMPLAQYKADLAVTKHGFARAEVREVRAEAYKYLNPHRSEPMYVVEGRAR
jgi:hypothetical protein